MSTAPPILRGFGSHRYPKPSRFVGLAIAGLAGTLLAGVGVSSHPGPAAAVAESDRDYVSLVNPWVESDIGRYFFFQSASNPFGFVKLRPDAHTASASAGYGKSSPVVKGFSHVHDWQLSGVQVMPTTGEPVSKLEGDSGWESPIDHVGEVAEPGYHRLHVDRYGSRPS